MGATSSRERRAASSFSRTLLRGFACSLFVGTLGLAQAPEPRQDAPAFEVASVRPDTGGAVPFTFVEPIAMRAGGRFDAQARLRRIIAYAYEVPFERVEGSQPILDQRFFIAAVAPGGFRDSERDHRVLVRRLLAERFALRVRVHEESQAVYLLQRVRAADQTPGLRPLTTDCSSSAGRDGPAPGDAAAEACRHIGLVNGRLTARIDTLNDLAAFLSRLQSRTVIDASGLRGPFELDVVFDPGTFTDNPRPSALTHLPTFQEALRHQLGLELEIAEGVVGRLVVEHVEEPTPN